ncbi:TIGR03943 family putative permease subunit [Paenibacillus sp. GYB003]|uniref:TIGR03943 family putative permease subunit n=1 Tax=Paenibacillus sp. GYB003 TaxID=2994392 RepID=UPI002F962AA9
MAERRSLTAHYWFRAFIMSGFAFYILHLTKTGRLMYYIAPRMEVYVKCAAIGLFVFALYQGFLGLRSFFGKDGEPCDCGHEPPRSIVRNVWLYGLFLLPLTLGFLLPDKLMGSDIAAMKGMNLGGGIGGVARADKTGGVGEAASAGGAAADANAGVDAGPSAQGPAPGVSAADPTGSAPGSETWAERPGAAVGDELDKLFAADDFNKPFVGLGKKLYAKEKIVIKEEGFMELLTTVDLFLDRYIGKTMELTGFVYREPDMADNQFVVARLAMQCCSADSSPYGVMVESPMAKKLGKDQWVKLVGTIGKTKYNDNEIMKLDASSIQNVQAPETPYVYPYFEAFEELAD